jgi:broad specificity phosphatase PhoE
MSQSHIILVRHGEASASWSAHPDPGLSELGRLQAEKTGKSLIDQMHLYQLVSSPKKRAVETMELIRQEKNYSFELDDRFIEIPSENVASKAKKDWLITIFKAPIAELPGAIKNWRDNLITWIDNANGNFIVTTHYMVINALISYLANSKSISYFHPDYASRTEIFLKNGELTKLILGDDKKTVINL